MRRLNTTEPVVGPRAAPETFEAFFLAEHGRLLRALYLMTTDRADAEDVMQEAFLKVWDRWDRVRAMNSPTGYLYRTALNIVRSRARRVARGIRRAIGSSVPVDPIAAADQRDAVVRALRELSPRQREAVVLTELLDMDVAAVATTMAIRESTVRSLTAQGRAAMRVRLGGDR